MLRKDGAADSRRDAAEVKIDYGCSRERRQVAAADVQWCFPNDSLRCSYKQNTARRLLWVLRIYEPVEGEVVAVLADQANLGAVPPPRQFWRLVSRAILVGEYMCSSF